MEPLRIIQFFTGFLSNPRGVGSVIPSSGYLATAILKDVDFAKLDLVVEYGPGTGAFTSHLVDRITNTNTHLMVVEFNAKFAASLRKKFPEIEIRVDRAANIGTMLKGKPESVDLVISSLPFSLFDWEETALTTSETFAALKDGGIFRTYIYGHTLLFGSNRRLLKLFRETFGEVKTWGVLLNFPPAIVIECRKNAN